ncbi:hypothetical protein [Aliiroseovarius crassostreae]|uniref:hypothetical protein n=1 Tax=Aliiroseovarius crassostreae TaxID=154981 RepID=UPI0022050A85|nr:hypothetical protein [Aliiroseovarius crassostreae]UWP98349.1 hypothetical protein K3X53_13590 [Aliiroseovarius crassostreae]
MTRIALPSVNRFLMMPLLVAALSLNPVSLAPSFAGSRDNNDEIGALIAALLGLAVVGAVISNDNNDNRRRPSVDHDRYDDRYRRDPKYTLPRQCLRNFKTQFGKKRYWGRNCLKKRYNHVRSLPRACRDTVVVKNKNGVWVSRKVYQPRCLREAGYRKRR